MHTGYVPGYGVGVGVGVGFWRPTNSDNKDNSKPRQFTK